MSGPSSSFLDLRALSSQKIENLLALAKRVKHKELRTHRPFSLGETVALLFFEPSTRTRFSFETAAQRLGLGPLLLDGGINSSLEKGETIEDSILNIAAMSPQFLVIRCGDAVDLAEMQKKVNMPIINAGWGMRGHPTQALLDVFTISERLGSLQSKKVLFIGDVRHSRVVASHLEILPKLGAEAGVAAPDAFMPLNYNGKRFSNLNEALEWADVAIALRWQLERHDGLSFSKDEFKAHFGLNLVRLKYLKSTGLIMHPGPVNWGIEMETKVMEDPRCSVLEQVSHGVYLREALLRQMASEAQ